VGVSGLHLRVGGGVRLGSMLLLEGALVAVALEELLVIFLHLVHVQLATAAAILCIQGFFLFCCQVDHHLSLDLLIEEVLLYFVLVVEQSSNVGKVFRIE